MLMKPSEDDDVAELHREILDYLSAHPKAADTLDGILGWWLPRQRYERARKELLRALEELTARGLVERVRIENGTVIYRRPERKV
jgi:hypothetical protein